MRLILAVTAAFFFLADIGNAGAKREIHGRVVDDTGQPVAGADVTPFWSANGRLFDADGRPFDFNSVEGQKTYAASLGKMYPLGDVKNPTKTGLDGEFSINVGDTVHHLMAMDQPRASGGLVILPKADGKEIIEIRLERLVRIKGSFEGPAAGERPGADAMVVALVPDDPVRPLDMTRLAVCGSVESRFEMSLPPGRYVLNAYSYKGDGAEMAKAEVIPDREILLGGDTSELDLGVLLLSPYKLPITTRIERAKAAGTWDDYTKHFGEKLPRWHVIDARGVNKEVQISDFKGKWVLVYFWGLSCNPCLRTGIPKLMKFQDEHRAESERFKIILMCVDLDDDLKSVADLDRRLEPVVKHVWKRPIPFPVLLDPTFTTWERYGLTFFGTLILIDPEGNLVEGDETVLAEMLKQQ
jgi:thiol-disulfide isomerase/thioredoxin